MLAAGVDGTVHAATIATDPDRDQQWALNAVDYEDAWATNTGTGVKVAVLDSGVRRDHEDLVGNVDNGADCVDKTTSGACTTGTGVGGTDVYGHGTHVAGILAADANNGLGIAGGAPGAHIIPVQVLDSTGSGSFADVALGILWATDHGARVISLSLTGADGSSGLQDAVNYALAHNVVVVAAAGNNYQQDNSQQYPASYSGVISVGAIQNASPYTRASYSNTTSNVALVAPGSTILSTLRTSTSSYGNMTGTSMATPYVSAAAAIVLGANSTLTPAQVATTLESTATPLADSTGIGSPTGFGIVNPVAALATVPSTTSTSSTSSTTTTTVAPTTTTTKPAVTTQVAPGYWVAARNGQVRNFGVPSYGDRVGSASGPVVALAATATARGYWLTTAAGVVYTQGDAHSYGDARNLRLKAPIIAMAATSTGKGYWLLGADGGIFTYGDARFYGSTGARKLNKPIVDFAPTPSGKGYWLIGGDGGVFTFGDARFFGSTGAMKLAAPVVSMGPNPNGGYWLIASDGGVFTFGPNFYGSLVSRGVHKTAIRLRVTPSGKGYWVLTSDGAVYAFGDAPSKGSAAMSPAVDIAVG